MTMSKPLVVIADPDEQYAAMLEREFLEKLGDGTQMEVISLFDNLGKGSSGAAVQCMNLMLGLPETEGLE